jgi:maltoporin
MQEVVKTEGGEVIVEIQYLPAQKLLRANWKGSYLSLEEVQKGALAALDYLKRYEAPFLFNDNRELEGAWDEANDWVAQVWMPQAIAAGMKKFAHILAKDLYAQLSAEFMEENSRKVGDFQMRLFGDEPEALRWLLSA